MATATALPDANSEKITTRSSDYVWMIGSPLEQLTGARLPSGRDVMCNFLYYHRLKKLPIRDSASAVYDQLMPFWSKARLPVRAKHHIVTKIEDLYQEYKSLMKHRTSSNEKNTLNQNQYSEKLEMASAGHKLH
jgi:hypothetical protein